MALAFDSQRLQISGDAVPIAQNVRSSSSNHRAAFSASSNGWIVYHAVSSASLRTLTWLDREGKRNRLSGLSADLGIVHFSPDRKKLAAAITDHNNNDIWIVDVERGIRTRVTVDAAAENSAVWSPDGRYVAFGSTRNGR